MASAILTSIRFISVIEGKHQSVETLSAKGDRFVYANGGRLSASQSVTSGTLRTSLLCVDDRPGVIALLPESPFRNKCCGGRWPASLLRYEALRFGHVTWTRTGHGDRRCANSEISIRGRARLCGVSCWMFVVLEIRYWSRQAVPVYISTSGIIEA